jgi:hypothetical protein
MRKSTGLAALMMGALVTLPLSAGLIVIPQPNAGYTSSTTLLPVTAAELSNTGSVNDATLTASFSDPLQVAFVPTDWFNWGTPPAVENPSPTVLITPGSDATLLTITFSQALSTFGLEAMPDAFGTTTMTETFYNGSTSLGSIVLTPDGSVSALLFAASSTTPITSVTITAANTDFAIGNLRYALAAPEPNTWIGLGTGLALIAGFARRRQRS